MRQSWETMTSVSAGHIILTPTQPVRSGQPQQESNPAPPHQESLALPTELPRPPLKWRSCRRIFISSAACTLDRAGRGDHDFCLSQSHYTDTDPTSRDRRPQRESNPEPPRSTDWATAVYNFTEAHLEDYILSCEHCFSSEKQPKTVSLQHRAIEYQPIKTAPVHYPGIFLNPSNFEGTKLNISGVIHVRVRPWPEDRT